MWWRIKVNIFSHLLLILWDKYFFLIRLYLMVFKKLFDLIHVLRNIPA